MTPTSDQDRRAGVPRLLVLPTLLARRSHFLFGPRQTGKTYLIRHGLPGVRTYDLLESAVYLDLSRSPGRLGQELSPRDKIVAIDEIQRLPELLNEVHRLIETRGVRFLLTGSSPRKLRRGGVNLLGGRARTARLHPLCRQELGDRFELGRAIARGTLPAIYFSDDPGTDLTAYAGTYLQEEVVAEGAARNVPAFSRFLRVAAFCNGTMVNFTKLASDAQVARTTVHEYFRILVDTLILHELPAWRRTIKRKPIAASKYYLFDVGVVGALQGRAFRRGTPEFGSALETYTMHELICHRDYRGGGPISYWRSTAGHEVDFIVGDHTAIEVKASATVSTADLRSLRALAEEHLLKNYVCVCLAERPREVDGVQVLPYEEFLARLSAGAFKD